ncbi:MAG TPA: hypothetical protein VFN61_16700 [Acidimicrobiales bacterium]|nr:hypothetical protein [Acidimicrobiales bacterium]
MTDGLPTRRRWHRWALFTLVGTLGAGGVASGVLLSAGNRGSLAASARLLAASTLGAAGADQAAVSYVDRHDPGPGAAQVFTTEPDVDRGIRVYDVRVLAPNGTTYVVHIQQSNDAVLFASSAEQQTAPTPTTRTAPLATSPPGRPPAAANPASTTPPLQASEAVEAPEATAATESGADSGDRSGTSEASSSDHVKAASSGNDS